jgi:hypothetical protein
MLCVVTISCGDPAGLSDTLDSLRPWFDLSPMSWEHVLVDSSPEANREVLAGLPEGWPLVRVETPAEGVYAALNVGAEVARSATLLFLNGGDRLYDTGLLQRAVALLERDPSLDLVCCGARLMRDGVYLYDRLPRRTLGRSLLGANALPHQGIVYRRTLFDRVGPFDATYRIVGDYQHHLRCLALGIRARCLKECLVEFDMGGVSWEQHQPSLEEQSRIRRELADRLPTAFRACDAVAFPLERARLQAVKAAAASPGAALLRPLWLAWNRLRNRARL